MALVGLVLAFSAFALNVSPVSGMHLEDLQVELELPDTTELVMVFISAPDIPANADPHFGALVKKAKRRLKLLAEERGFSFATAGVAVEWNAAAGIRYLTQGESAGFQHYPIQDFGEWDEIHSGRNWYNHVVADWVFRSQGEDSGPLATGIPQILILRRSVRTQEHWISFGGEKILRRLIGPTAIRAWLDSKQPLIDLSEPG